MTISEEIATKHGLIALPASDDYVSLFDPRNLHWGEPATIGAIADIAKQMREVHPQYRIEIGNITGPDRVNTYSVSHQGRNFDMAYPYADGNSGALDHLGKTSSPYRQKPAEIDYGMLHTLLRIITGHPVNHHALVGFSVYERLRSFIKEHGLSTLPKVQAHAGHDDHIHVAMNAG